MPRYIAHRRLDPQKNATAKLSRKRNNMGSYHMHRKRERRKDEWMAFYKLLVQIKRISDMALYVTEY